MSMSTRTDPRRTSASPVPGPGAAVLCLDLGGTAVKAAVARDGAVVDHHEQPIGDDGAIPTIRRAAEVLAARGAVGPSGPGSFDRVAIAVPGIVDRDRNTLTAAYGKYRDLLDADLDAWCRRELGAPATIENDARAALLGETASGVAVGATDAVLMTLGTGIGTAAMTDGRLVRGVHDHGGVLGGHVTVEIDGPPCNCGNTGCAEALASTWSLGRTLRHRPNVAASDWPARLDAGPIGFRELVEAADADDPIARDVLDRCTRVWGAVLVGLCHAYDPTVVVVTGGVLRAGDRVLGPVRRYLDEHLWRSLPRPDVVAPTQPDRSVVRGLARAATSSATDVPHPDDDHSRKDAR
ncbi:ROK family protein [Curtobacterium flaccumfaciens]|nr:ROK family protein [Curtobacterium flaccumfaciens]